MSVSDPGLEINPTEKSLKKISNAYSKKQKQQHKNPNIYTVKKSIHVSL